MRRLYKTIIENEANRLLSILVALTLVASLGISTPQALAMGNPPSTCPNLYGSTITSMTINSDGIAYNPMLIPAITAQIGVGYVVTLTLHTDPQSLSGNTLDGTTWYRDTAFGFANGHCVNNVGPNKDITITRTIVCSVCKDGMIQQVEWRPASSGTQITYFVRWHNDPFIPIIVPTNLSVMTESSSQIDLRWSAPSIPDITVTGYKIERSTDNGSTWTTIIDNTDSTLTAYSDIGLAHSTTYTYRVSTITLIGSSSPSNMDSATTFDVMPSPPLGLTAVATSSSEIDLSWNAPSDDGGSPLVNYQLERSDDSGSTWLIITNSSSATTTYSDIGLSPNTTYTYRAYAVNSVGVSDPSNIAVATTPFD